MFNVSLLKIILKHVLFMFVYVWGHGHVCSEMKEQLKGTVTKGPGN